MNCRICNNSTSVIFETKVLRKYDVKYYQCSSCQFIQTEDPYWLPEAYENVITKLDIGLVSRNQYLLENIPVIIDRCFPKAKTMVDYGGGYGIFVRMMRDSGYNFLRHDIYCENLFSKHFDMTDYPNAKVDLVTAFEVFEHLKDPLEEIEKMVKLSGNIIFSTTLIPKDVSQFKDWWYVAPLTGQHVSFYSVDSLKVVAKKHNLNFYTNNNNLHFFSKEVISETVVNELFFPKASLMERILSRFKRKPNANKKASLLQSDYDYILNKISKD